VGELLNAMLGGFANHNFPEYDFHMNTNLKQLPVGERIQIVEDLWDSIAADQSVLPLTPEQQAELDRRLDAYEADKDPGRSVEIVIAEIRDRL
jgi:putative addiction module component (TIGR02574 family)